MKRCHEIEFPCETVFGKVANLVLPYHPLLKRDQENLDKVVELCKEPQPNEEFAAQYLEDIIQEAVREYANILTEDPEFPAFKNYVGPFIFKYLVDRYSEDDNVCSDLIGGNALALWDVWSNTLRIRQERM